LKSISNPDRTITSASWTDWLRCLRGPISSSPSIVYSMAMISEPASINRRRSKQKRSAEQQVADEADRRALNLQATRQTIADSQAAPAFQENHKRLKAERIAREAGLKAKGKWRRKMPRIRWTLEEDERLLNLIAAGKSWTLISGMLKRSMKSVKLHAKTLRLLGAKKNES
jgi:DNA-binding NarL/FixJ family response regulator